MNSFQKKIVQKAIKNSDLLDEYEFDFVKNLSDKDVDLSKKQNHMLNQISNKLIRR